MSVQLDEVRNRIQELMRTQPAETSPELEWLVQEMDRHKTVLMDIVDYLLIQQDERSGAGGA